MAISAVKNCTWAQPSHHIHLSRRFAGSSLLLLGWNHLNPPIPRDSVTIYSEKQNQISERGINVKLCKYKKCISADAWNKFLCFITKWEEVWWAPTGRTWLAGSWAWHHTFVPCLGPPKWFLLSWCFTVSREGGCAGKEELLTFVNQEDVMCGSIWGMIGFLSLKQIFAFKHQWNTHNQNMASISTW